MHNYMNRFTKTIQELVEIEESTVMMTLLDGLKGTRFVVDLVNTKAKPSQRICFGPKEP